MHKRGKATSLSRDASGEAAPDDSAGRECGRHGGGSAEIGGVSSGITIEMANKMKSDINKHWETVANILMGSKESQDRKRLIDLAFRTCYEAFAEMHTAYMVAVGAMSTMEGMKMEEIKKAVVEAIGNEGGALGPGAGKNRAGIYPARGRSFADVVRDETPRVRLAGGPAVEIPKTTDFLIVPQAEAADRFEDSHAIRATVQRVLKPSKMALKVKKMTTVGKRSVRIEAVNPDLDEIERSSELRDAGLMIRRELKLNPRLIIHDVPTGMTGEQICEEVVALNLRDLRDPVVNPIYIFPAKNNKRSTSCIVELSPHTRDAIFKLSHIFVAFSACKFADYVRVVQCYKCLGFGHVAANCESSSLCGHCAEEHETRDCPNRDRVPTCANCKRWHPRDDLRHAATDRKKCPIILRRVMDKIKITNYG